MPGLRIPVVELPGFLAMICGGAVDHSLEIQSGYNYNGNWGSDDLLAERFVVGYHDD